MQAQSDKIGLLVMQGSQCDTELGELLLRFSLSLHSTPCSSTCS